jgi:hypothetical protein
MDRHAAFAVWAPAGVAWSAWVKPVLFAHLPPTVAPGYGHTFFPCPSPEAIAEAPPSPPARRDVSWLPPAGERIALVVDAPGPEAVALGLAAAERG